ncbi:AbiH family protein [Listeria monocytogenes]|uniref:AbiH family protein n=1 Tax=Listeria monocytogenes TaxID=1639 RepID=UPI0015E693C8|nr:AbiH family protein [Listeria monocytogenes]
MIDNNKNLTNINIMNFNFTCNIFDDLDDVSIKLGTEVNVHGKVDILDESKIIFGIDKKSLDREGIKEGNDLTKTSRKLVMNEIKIASVLDNTISNIIFYGHSLSEADYAYFQSIFDYLDIYNNQIQLTFYYTNYLEDEQDFETVRREQVTAVRTLIEEYGSTLDNEAKGKNLLHKLLLEERISVFEL